MPMPSARATATISLCQPVGTVISYMGAASTLAGLAPLGWLPCDGSSLSSTDFPDLFAAIGTHYGGDGKPQFNLPDLRGMFLRGVGPAGDPDAEHRMSPIPGDQTVVGAIVGSRQTGEVQDHQHFWNDNIFQARGFFSGATNVQSWGSDTGPPLPTTNVDGGGAETRPCNVYAYFLIFTGLPQTGAE